MAEDYADILDRGWEEIPQVKTLPVGSWLLEGTNASFKAGDDSNDSIIFVYKAKEPMDDVDTDQLDELGADYDYSDNRIFARLWLETNADWDKVRNHLVKHGIDVSGKISDSLKEFKGSQVVSYLDTRTYTNSVGDEVVDNDPVQFAVHE